eukprot:COSAG01_NODE_582_length_15201_cov_7.218315_20_plen_136_part_00
MAAARQRMPAVVIPTATQSPPRDACLPACLQSAVDLSALLELLSSVEQKLASDPRFPKLVADHDMRLWGSVARKRPARAAAREYGYGARPPPLRLPSTHARTHAMHVSGQQTTHDDMLAEAAATELPPCCRGPLN